MTTIAAAASLLSPAVAGSPPAGDAPVSDAQAPAATAEAPASRGGEAAAFHRRIEREGVAVDLEIESLGETGELRQGDAVVVRFRITDTNTRQPLSSLYPAAWMDRLPEVSEEKPDSCQQKVESFIGGTLLAQPELDLNVYYVLALNADPTISVVDPLFGFGNTKLLAMAFLEAPGYDWTLTEDQRLLFVSLPEVDKVAVVSTFDWKVLTNIDVGPRPGRLALQPDGKYLWVAYREPLHGAEASGISVIDVDRLRRVRHVETGRGDHDLAFSHQGGHAFVTNRADGTVSVIDTGSLEVVRRIATARDPVSIAHSPAGGSVYVSHGASGVITAIDADSLEVTARIEAEPGLGQIRFVPDSRLALVVNPAEDVLHIVDAAARRIIQTGDMADGPDQVGFSEELAYIRHRGSETIYMIPLDEIGQEGKPVPVVDFPGGQHPAGKSSAPTPAPGIIQAPGATAVLVANPLDKSIYFYKEGMAAPMGHFKNYSREPRAVRVVDRSLQEIAPGVYETAVKLRRPGSYDLAFFLDAPRLTHCFQLRVQENPALAEQRRRDLEPLEVRYRVEDLYVTVGEEVTVRFELREPVAHEPREGLRDVEVLTFLAPGVWQQRHHATEVEAGLYEIHFTPPRPGVYYVFVQSRSMGFGYQSSPYLTLMARKAGEGAGTGATK